MITALSKILKLAISRQYPEFLKNSGSFQDWWILKFWIEKQVPWHKLSGIKPNMLKPVGMEESPFFWKVRISDLVRTLGPKSGPKPDLNILQFELEIDL